MDVLLLNPPKFRERNLSIDPILIRCSGIPSKAPYLWPPIGLAYTAGCVKNISNIKILDAQAEDLDERDVAKKCKNFDLVVTSAGTQTIKRDLELCKLIKEKSGVKIALMGAHVTYFHSELIKNNFIDFIIKGEPEKIVYNLIKNIDNPKKVKGITWRNKEKIVANKKEQLIEDLDSMPFAARHLLPNEKYYDILTKKHPITFMITSRGCPFNCTFCSANFYNERKYRYRSATNVIKEIEEIVSDGFRDISIFDDTFTINKKRVIEISESIKDFGISWRCLSRTDTVDKEMLKKMYDSGCYQIQFGVESGDQAMLNKMKKGIKSGYIKKVFDWCNQIGIETVGFFILGYPGETMKTIDKTVNFARKIQPDFVTFNLLTPLPNSEIFEALKPKEKWENFDFTSTSFCSIPSEEMQKIVAEAYRNYYVRISYLLRRIRKTKDPYRIIKQNILFWMKKSGILWEFLNR